MKYREDIPKVSIEQVMLGDFGNWSHVNFEQVELFLVRWSHSSHIFLFLIEKSSLIRCGFNLHLIDFERLSVSLLVTSGAAGVPRKQRSIPPPVQ